MLRFLKVTLASGVPFGLFMGFYLNSVVGGLASGLVFGLLLAGFLEWQRSRFVKEDPCVEGETLLKQGPANHFRKIESVGGWLYLTDRRLVFRSHRFNVQKHELSIPLEEIVSVEACLTLWVIPNGLRVIADQRTERFVVEGRRQWVEEIEQAMR